MREPLPRNGIGCGKSGDGREESATVRICGPFAARRTAGRVPFAPNNVRRPSLPFPSFRVRQAGVTMDRTKCVITENCRELCTRAPIDNGNDAFERIGLLSATIDECRAPQHPQHSRP